MQKFDCQHCHRIFKSDPKKDDIVLCPHCNSTVAIPEEDLFPGTIIAGFEIIRLLGHGGMGNVYMANQISMNRPVALKILLKSMTKDKESVRQFLNEARVSGQMNHKNIITAIDAGEIDDTYFLVTTFVDGHDLEKKIEEEKIVPEKESLRIILNVGEALKYAWENHGILHKDIKPANIMLDSNKEVYLMDMGIAQFIGEAPPEDQHILGSPFFMSPEQTRGEKLSWTSDLYSLGATLYNMIVGVPPYDADDVIKIIEMHSTEPFPLPSSRNPDAKVSKLTIQLLKRMMGKKPEDRFDSWDGFKETVNKILKAEKAPSKTKTQKTNSQKKKTKKKRVTKRKYIVQKKSGGGGGAIFVICLIFIVVIFGAAYLFFTSNVNENARLALNKAERYIINHPGDYYSGIEFFRIAAERGKGTPTAARSRRRLYEIREENKIQIELHKKYRDAKKEAATMAQEKQFEEAVSLIRESVKNIKKKTTIKDAEFRIKMIKAQESKHKGSY